MIAARDMTAFIIAAIHINLCIGTLCSFVKERPDLQDLLDKLLNFDICGEFMLTEVDHGLDARNLETTATLLPDAPTIWILLMQELQKQCLRQHRIAKCPASP